MIRPFLLGPWACRQTRAAWFGVRAQSMGLNKKEKGPQVFDLRAFMIGAQERTRTSTPLSAST